MGNLFSYRYKDKIDRNDNIIKEHSQSVVELESESISTYSCSPPFLPNLSLKIHDNGQINNEELFLNWIKSIYSLDFGSYKNLYILNNHLNILDNLENKSKLKPEIELIGSCEYLYDENKNGNDDYQSERILLRFTYYQFDHRKWRQIKEYLCFENIANDYKNYNYQDNNDMDDMDIEFIFGIENVDKNILLLLKSNIPYVIEPKFEVKVKLQFDRIINIKERKTKKQELGINDDNLLFLNLSHLEII